MEVSITDVLMRDAAFEQVRRLQQTHDALTAEVLKGGFQFEGERIPLLNRQLGIFKPRQMQFLLSIKTVVPRPGRNASYDDQRRSHHQIFEGDASVEYAFMGKDPNAAANRWLREAFENDMPVIYFLGVAPARYLAILPTFIVGWNAKTLKADVAFGLPETRSQPVHKHKAVSVDQIGTLPSSDVERRYALRSVKQRLHQSSFRAAVIQAYRGRCAISGIPEPLLLDAAHIVPDTNESLGQPIVPNGLPLSKIHHAAFDAHLLGIDPDYRIHVSDRLLERQDGPMLQALKDLAGRAIHLPRRPVDRPDPERLERRFESFRAAA